MSTFFFFFNDPATTEIYTLSLHDALPICWCVLTRHRLQRLCYQARLHTREGRLPLILWIRPTKVGERADRKSTRLNSSHPSISYAVFCLKKKKKKKKNTIIL